MRARVTIRWRSPLGPGAGPEVSSSVGTVIYVTLLEVWRSQADTDGRLRTHADSAASGPGTRAWFAPGEERLQCTQEQRVLPKVPGYNAQRHRQDHERHSGVELGIRALPAGLHPRQLAQIA
jgi:hypothetical protein